MSTDGTRRQAFADWLPFAYVLCLSANEFWANLQRREPSAYLVGFIAFLPMAFFLSGLAFMRYRKRIEALERRLSELESSASMKG
jgi:hypothetical protein